MSDPDTGKNENILKILKIHTGTQPSPPHLGAN